MAQVVRPYRGVSADQRRADRRARLVDAGLDMVGSDGLADTTMRGVCARAGLTERYFYESFSDLGDLLCAVHDALTRDTDQAMIDAVASAPPDLFERCRAAMGGFVSVLSDDPRKARFYIEAMGSEALKTRRAESVRNTARVLAAQMIELEGLGGKEDRARLQLVTLVITSGTAEATTAWLAGQLDLSRDQLIDECARLCVAAADAARGTRA